MKKFTLRNAYCSLSRIQEALPGKISILLLIMLLSCSSLFAQQKVLITGIVASAKDNNVLPGVTVVVKGTTNGFITDERGRYSLEANEGDTLIFRYIGFVEKHVKVGSQRTISVSLSPVSNQLDDLVVVAFGKQKKSDMVGSVTSINPSDLKVPSSNLTTALAGRAAGVIAFQRSGEPGQDNAQFFIRG